jgi:uncharacterized membrane protein
MRIKDDGLDYQYGNPSGNVDKNDIRSVKRSEMVPGDLGLKLIDDRPVIFRRICHGDPSRSLWFRGHPLPLCSRCIFFYPSLLIGIIPGILNIALIDPPVVSMLVFTLVSLSPLVVDGLTQYYGMRRSNNILRIVTGTMAGLGSGIATPFLFYRFYLALF